MVALVFLSVIAAVFVTVVALEGGDPSLERRPKGLLSWIASGNWPAKIGGALIVVGVGALLRYAAINFDVAPAFKLALGIGATAALGFASFLTAANTQRRVISLALGGAAFGVAYLTAYSSFALFGYLPTMQGLGVLVLTAFGAGILAVSRGALSLASIGLQSVVLVLLSLAQFFRSRRQIDLRHPDRGASGFLPLFLYVYGCISVEVMYLVAGLGYLVLFQLCVVLDWNALMGGRFGRIQLL